MPSRNQYTDVKSIGFPHWLFLEISNALVRDCSSDFSTWVIDACRLKLRADQGIKPKVQE
ncbi:DUF3950 domain-containing protein [Salmonella enterica]|nr:DUF3950 domain-containing protein [Salmonella enterica]